MRKFFYALAVALLACSANVQAAYTATLSQVGPNVVATGSGSLNLTALAFFSNVLAPAVITGNTAVLGTGPAVPTAVTSYTGIAGSTNFGPGIQTLASSGFGDVVAVAGNSTAIGVPQGYVSGAALNSGATWNGTTFAALGITPGTYVWTWGAGPTADSFTLQIAQPSADLQITQVASSAAVTVGSTISYAITISNAGPSNAQTVSVTDNLAAAGLVLLSAQSSLGVLTTSSNSLNWDVGTLASGASGTLTVVASASAGAGSITHTVTVSGSYFDPNLANNVSVQFASRIAAPVAPAGPAAIPTLSEWAMILLVSLMAGFAMTTLSSRTWLMPWHHGRLDSQNRSVVASASSKTAVPAFNTNSDAP